MVIALFGDSCTGKCTIAEALAGPLAAVAAMLERKYSRFETEEHELHIDTDATSVEQATRQIFSRLEEERHGLH